MNQTATGPKCFGTTKRKSFVDEFDKDIPGPGAYESIRLDRIENPEWVIGTEQQRNSFIDSHCFQLPAPNIYKPNYAAIEKMPIKYSITQGKRQFKSVDNFAPQIKADISVIKAQNPQYTFGYANQKTYDNNLPGVGSYQLENHATIFNKTQHHFGTGKRPMPHGEEGNFPSATKYNTIDFNRTTKYSFSKTERVIHRKNEDPPAKFYDISNKRKAPNNTKFFDIRAKKRQTMLFEANENPGPNHYSPQQITKIQSGTIEHSKRLPPENIAILEYPSPDKYSGDQVHHKNKKGYSFVKTIRQLSKDDETVPGPGAYEPISTLRSVGGVIGKSKQKQMDVTKVVPPGANFYRPKINITRPKAKSTIVFRSDRLDFSKTITGPIGPGQYELRNDNLKGESGKIGSSRRPELYSTPKNPGVGDYDIPGGIGRLPKYYTSPKKMTQTGYSTFHQKLRIKMLERQRNKQLEEERELKLEGKSEDMSEDVDRLKQKGNIAEAKE